MRLSTLLMFFQLVNGWWSCNSPTSYKQEKIAIDTELSQYYKLNKWDYPVEIDTSDIVYHGFNTTDKNGLGSYLERELYNWCISDSILEKGRRAECLSISSIEITLLTEFKSRLTCRIDYYRLAVKQNGLVVPIEGYAIVNNKFLKRYEIAEFVLHGDSL